MLQKIQLPPLAPQPLVSVLLPNYNYRQYVGQAIESVLRQGYSNWELIVCDDGSTDDSASLIERYATQERRIRFVRQENAGHSAAVNRAYQQCRGDVIAILDADDAFAPGKLQHVVDQFRAKPQSGLLVHAMTMVDSQGAALHRIPLGDFEEGWIAERLVRRGGRWRYMPSSGLAFRRELAELAFPIPQHKLPQGAEGYLFTLIPLLSEVTFLPHELSIYRIHQSNMGGRTGVDPAAARKGAALMTRVIEATNYRLEQMGSPARLRPEDHLQIQLEYLNANLLEGEPLLALWRRYARAARAILADDLFRTRQKLPLVALWGGAVLLPRSWRRGWLNLAGSQSWLKRTISRWTAARQGRSRQTLARA